jgi:hypothetical protein
MFEDKNPTIMQQDADQSAYIPLEKVVVVMDGVVDEASFVNPPRPGDCSQRLMILIPGVAFGCISVVPNLMLIDAGTNQAMTATTIGLLASVMFVLAGVIGAFLKTWAFYAVALLLQLIAFIIVSYS